jgi:hypothetical protein
MSIEQKKRAIEMRNEGKTYHEIRVEIPVAKSTLSLWFKDFGLSVPQKQRITQKRKDASLRGAKARKDKRLKEIENLNKVGIEEVGKLSSRELWLIGTVLHWAEGSKQKENNPSTGIIFTNSDPKMLRIYLKWLRALGISSDQIKFEMYVHGNRAEEVQVFKNWWSEQLNIELNAIGSVYFKRYKILTNRKNVKDLYHGLIRIRVQGSTSLNRQVNGWIEGVSAFA